MRIQFAQSVKKILKETEVAKPALIAAVKFMENFYAGKTKNLERVEVARKTINVYLKLRSAEAKLLREIAKREL